MMKEIEGQVSWTRLNAQGRMLGLFTEHHRPSAGRSKIRYGPSAKWLVV
jgi:hypothetical protein